MKEKLIEAYDLLGAEYFSRASDLQLKAWGHTQEQINEMKIKAIENQLQFNKKGVKVYKVINELCGGKNKY